VTQHNHHSPSVERLCDVAIIGGSAAGLGAALQLVRQRRSVVVVDSDTPRNAVAAHMHSYLGYEGAPPSDLIAAGRAEVRSYGGEVLTGMALNVERVGDRFRIDLSGGHSLLASRVLVATGLVDELPDIEGLAQHWGDTVISCPFCHGYEVRERRIVHIVTNPIALHTAPIYRSLSEHYSIVVHNTSIDSSELNNLQSAGVPVYSSSVRRIFDTNGRLSAVELEDGTVIDADAVVIAPSFHARTEAFAGLGLKMADHPSGLGATVEVDQMGATSVLGMFAAGNVADATLQVLPAAAHGSRVGAAIAMSLALDGLGVDHGASDWDHRYSGDSIWSGNPNGTLVHEVESLTPGTALDVGSGEGADAVWLAERGWTVTANDVSSQALARVEEHANQRNVTMSYLHSNAANLDALPTASFDLVSLQYGAIPRSPDSRGAHNLIGAVAPGGTLLVVAHDLEPMREPVDSAEQTRMWDPEAFEGVDDFAKVLATLPGWTIECNEKRPRPGGAATPQHIDDVVLRARRN
jgi:thioredoxin reductase/SAM-dependent methyltransferase